MNVIIELSGVVFLVYFVEVRPDRQRDTPPPKLAQNATGTTLVELRTNMNPPCLFGLILSKKPLSGAVFLPWEPNLKHDK